MNLLQFGSNCDNPVNGTANMGSTLTILENDDLLISGIYGEISGLAPDQTRQGNEKILIAINALNLCTYVYN